MVSSDSSPPSLAFICVLIRVRDLSTSGVDERFLQSRGKLESPACNDTHQSNEINVDNKP